MANTKSLFASVCQSSACNFLNINALKIAVRSSYTPCTTPGRRVARVSAFKSRLVLAVGHWAFNLPPCASVSSSEDRDNHSTYLRGMLAAQMNLV